MLREISALLFSTVFSQRIQLSIWLIAMGVRMEMAEVVSMEPRRKCQEKFLQRFFDGAISNFFLDSFDFNESHHHQLPPSRLANRWAEETISDSMQIDEGSLYSIDSVQRFSAKVLPVSSSKPVGRGRVHLFSSLTFRR